MINKFFKNTALVIGVVALFTIVLEFASRSLIDNGMNYHLEMWKYAVKLKQKSKIIDVGHEHQPGKSARLMGVDVEINNLGYRDNPVSIENKNECFRILMLGDSITFGWGVPFDHTVSQRLEKILSQKFGKKIEVINTGVGNTNTSQQVSNFLAKGYRLKPDLIILNYFINDAEPTPSNEANYLYQRSFLLNLVVGSWDTFQRLFFTRPDWKQYYRALYRQNADGWLKTKRAFKKIAAYTIERDIPLLFVNYPELHNPTEYPFEEINTSLESMVRTNKIPYLSLLPSIQNIESESLWVSLSDPHPNSKATKLFADRITKYIESHRNEIFKNSLNKSCF